MMKFLMDRPLTKEMVKDGVIIHHINKKYLVARIVDKYYLINMKNGEDIVGAFDNVDEINKSFKYAFVILRSEYTMDLTARDQSKEDSKI